MKIGLALSGGGIRGIAHAGVLKALDENNITIDIIGGTSAGGLIASLYAIGYVPENIFMAFKRYAKDIVSLNYGPLISGFIGNKKSKFIGFNTGINMEKTYSNFAKEKGIENINEIKMPIVIPSVDLNNGKEYIFTNQLPKEKDDNVEYINDISLGKAIRASSSFPGIFYPCDFKKHRFLDGGVLDNIPVKEVKKQGADKVIAVTFEDDEINEASNAMDIAMHTINIMGSKNAEENLNFSDVVIKIKTNPMGLLEVKNIDNCYEQGYLETIRNIEKIKKMVDMQ